jgi:class 3 adenylate cyclase
MTRRFSSSWSHRFAGSAEEVWSFVADTSRYNEATGFPKHKVIPEPQPDGGMRFFGQLRLGWLTLKWEDFPADWIAPRRYLHRRVFSSGPFVEMTFDFQIEPQGDVSLGTYQLAMTPRNFIGWLILRSGRFHRAAERDCQRLMAELDAYLRDERVTPFDYQIAAPTASTRQRGARLAQEVEASGYGHGLASRLVDFVLTGSENDLSPLRPLHLAHIWKEDERLVVELCLQATKVGLLELEWAILCPRCQMPDESYRSLDQMPKGAHCPYCNVSFDGDFSANVELSFRPSPALREIDSGLFCFSGPLATPHILAQQRVASGGSEVLSLALPPGGYRVRSHDPGPERTFEVRASQRESEPAREPAAGQAADGAAASGQLTLLLTDQSLDLLAAGRAAPTDPQAGDGGPAVVLSAVSSLKMVNQSRRARSLVLERLAWRAEALTADRVTTYQAFRDLFSDQVLRAGDQVGISRAVLLFSDLHGSTALYERIGDARAYALVRQHFAFMAAIVRAHEGAVVKTIGDAVMAAFHREDKALAAGLAIQQQVAAFNKENPDGPLVIKLGLHAGPTIAVTLNDRLDYFGSTVNLAARLQAQSQGGDFVLSTAVAALPELQARLAEIPTEREEAVLKGFAAPVPFIRLRP